MITIILISLLSQQQPCVPLNLQGNSIIVTSLAEDVDEEDVMLPIRHVDSLEHVCGDIAVYISGEAIYPAFVITEDNGDQALFSWARVFGKPPTIFSNMRPVNHTAGTIVYIGPISSYERILVPRTPDRPGR